MIGVADNEDLSSRELIPVPNWRCCRVTAQTPPPLAARLAYRKCNNNNGLRRAKAIRAHLLLDHPVVWMRRVDHWVHAARFHRRVPSLVGRGRSLCHCECVFALHFYFFETYYYVL